MDARTDNAYLEEEVMVTIDIQSIKEKNQIKKIKKFLRKIKKKINLLRRNHPLKFYQTKLEPNKTMSRKRLTN